MLTGFIARGEYDLSVKQPWPEVSEEAKSLIGKMMEPNVDKRISAVEALEHPWIITADMNNKVERLYKCRSICLDIGTVKTRAKSDI